MRKICLLGGTGFVGQHLANRLFNMGWQVHILTRRPERHPELLVLPAVKLVSANIHDQAQLNIQLAGCEVVINLVGILNEEGNNGQGFRKVHVRLPQKIVTACKVNGIKRLLHISALNADGADGKSHYLRSKGAGEDIFHASALSVTTFRPSVIFGKDDIFFNQFAQLLRLFPFFFLLPCDDARFAPVWVNDVVDAMLKTLDDEQHYGKQYNLCGPDAYTLKELVEYTAKAIDLERHVIGLNDSIARFGARVMEFMPLKFKLFSRDNYASLQVDSVCDGNNNLETLGIMPHSLETILPKILNTPDSRAFYSKFRSNAGRSTTPELKSQGLEEQSLSPVD